MNFAPYQDQSPDIERALSPPPTTTKGRPSFETARTRSPPQRPQTHSRTTSDIQALPPPNAFRDDVPISPPIERGSHLEVFETSLTMRLDHEAMLAYIFLPPIGGLFLLVFEHKSDYVRFHAWQSSMLFAVILIIHILLSWSKFLSWILFACDLALIFFLARHAYRDVENLEHYEVPVFGRWANSFVDNE